MCAVSKQSGQQEAVCVWKKGGGDRFICGLFFLLTLNSLGKEQRESERGKRAGQMDGRKNRKKEKRRRWRER